MQILMPVMMQMLLLHAGILLLIATAVFAQSTDHHGPQAVYRKLEHALITDSKVGYLLQHTFFPSQRSSGGMIFIHVNATVDSMLPGSCGVLSLLPRNAINNSYYKEFQCSSSPLLNLISIDQLLILDNILSESWSASGKVQSYKYLGVLISSNLSWCNHVSNICSRAKKHLGMLYRRFYRDADCSTLRMLYTTSVRPLLEYAVPVWDPHLLKDIKAIKSVQRFATKVCTKAWLGVDYNDRLSMLNLTTLETRRTVLKHCFLYKVLNGLTLLPNPPIIPRPNTSHDTRSHTLTLQVPFAHSVSFYNSFCCQAPRLWNELPSEIVRSSSIASFKRACCIYLHLH